MMTPNIENKGNELNAQDFSIVVSKRLPFSLSGIELDQNEVKIDKKFGLSASPSVHCQCMLFF
ncbi:hypothetical protein N779_16970 [Vibrio coralliilyticus OCN008]|nr:hypothetical protein N779_16970 [Vibrio coralliilyticus OCN008]